MKARYYIKAHLTRDGQHEGWDVREVTGKVDVCHTPCDTEEEARAALKELTDAADLKAAAESASKDPENKRRAREYWRSTK